jgi:tetratricopeptide (TPR) repeat protein
VRRLRKACIAAAFSAVIAPTDAAADAVTASGRPSGESGAPARSWATSQAAELTRQGEAHLARGEVDTAARRYLDAIAFDATFGPAYLALGALHEKAGDPREAERAYAMGIDHVAGFSEAHLARARLRARLRRLPEAIVDLEAAASLLPEDIGVLRELSLAYVAVGALPAALAVNRRIEGLSDLQRDARAGAEARASIRALALLVGPADPVAAGALGRGSVRSALALYAKRR